MTENDKKKTPAPPTTVLGRLLGWQALFIAAAGAVVAASAGTSAATALTTGGGIHMLGGVLMARFALRAGPDSDARGALGALVIGEVVKFVFTILLFTAALVAFQVRPGYMLSGYLLATIGYWLILLKG